MKKIIAFLLIIIIVLQLYFIIYMKKSREEIIEGLTYISRNIDSVKSEIYKLENAMK
ncbi:MAG: hypothetical protein HFF90_07885 [Oscillibacter sp.]|nr:hypothetical protein [Oscillibacter sp.]